MMVLWRSSDHQAELDASKKAVEELLNEVRTDLEHLYNEEIIATLRATSSERARLENWQSLLNEARELFERRIGVQATKRLLGNLL
jgi:hypothetical protein